VQSKLVAILTSFWQGSFAIQALEAMAQFEMKADGCASAV